MNDAAVTPDAAALQREAAAAGRSGGASARPARGRGPHPLPLFLTLVQGECAGDADRLAAVLAGLKRYQSAPPAAPRPQHPVVAQCGSVRLRHIAGHGPPLVLVPSLINPAHVLDLAPGNSLAGHLAGQGWQVWLVDWGPVPEALGLAALAATRLAPLLGQAAALAGGPVPVLGYCLGGTLAAAAARAAAGEGAAATPVSALALLASPWRFDGYGDAARAALAQWWAGAAPLAQRLGAVPMDVLQPAFWSLDPGHLASKYARLATADAATLANFVMLEDWANGGAPLALAAAQDLAGLFADAGTGLDGAELPNVPLLDVVALADRIVPPAAAATAPGAPGRLDVPAGHVGMVVGRSAPQQLWAPLAAWLALQRDAKA